MKKFRGYYCKDLHVERGVAYYEDAAGTILPVTEVVDIESTRVPPGIMVSDELTQCVGTCHHGEHKKMLRELHVACLQFQERRRSRWT